MLSPEQAAALQLALLPLLGHAELLLPFEVDSTNTQVLARIKRGLTGPCVMAAVHQTAGRGRLGKTWAGAPGRSLTFSLGLPLAPREWAGLSLVVGTVLAEVLHPSICLKWPNDLWLMPSPTDAQAGGLPTPAPRKLAGILIETAGLEGSAHTGSLNGNVSGALAARGFAPALAIHEAARWCVVGVGINIGLPDVGPAEALAHSPNPMGAAAGTPQIQPVALQELVPSAQVGSVLCQVLPPLVRALLDFEVCGFATWQARFSARDALAGQELVLSDGRTGRAAGVDASGALLVHTALGAVAVTSADVSVRPLNRMN